MCEEPEEQGESAAGCWAADREAMRRNRRRHGTSSLSRAVCSLRRIGLSLLNPLVQLVLLRARDPQPNLKKPKCHPFKARHRRDAGKGVIFDIVHISRIIKSRNFRNDVISKKFRIFCKVYALISFIISIHYRQLLK